MKTTGKHSDNNHCLGHARDIAEQISDATTMYTMREVLWAMMCEAMDDGYPGKMVGELKVPQDWALATHEQANMVIEACHHFADEHGLSLMEYINGYDSAPVKVYSGKSRRPVV